LLEITACRSWPGFLAEFGGNADLIVADPSGIPVGEAVTRQATAVSVRLIGSVGPEGGFTSGELESACAAGAGIVSLGPRILRIETAGIVLATLLTTTARAIIDPRMPDSSANRRSLS
jgi:16S rRNA (uracil1498-N3)-methyltransferase